MHNTLTPVRIIFITHAWRLKLHNTILVKDMKGRTLTATLTLSPILKFVNLLVTVGVGGKFNLLRCNQANV